MRPKVTRSGMRRPGVPGMLGGVRAAPRPRREGAPKEWMTVKPVGRAADRYTLRTRGNRCPIVARMRAQPWRPSHRTPFSVTW